MQTSYRLNAKDLDQNFLDALKILFQDRDIEILVYAVDETSYLSSSKTNHSHLLKAIKNIEERSNLIAVNLEELE